MLTLKAFGKDQGGNIALIFGLTLLPIAMAVGVAVDYSRAASARTEMQSAADSAALAIAHEASTSSSADATKTGRQYFDANFLTRIVNLSSFKVDRKGNEVIVTATGKMQTGMMAIAGVKTMDIGVEARTGWAPQKMEIALVLDNTGSMAQFGKMDALKKASKQFLDALQKGATQPDTFKVAVVPFNTQVNVGTGFANAAWLDFKHPGLDLSIAATLANWVGCVADRDQPYDTNAATPGAATATHYPAAICAKNPWTPVPPAALHGLTNNYGTLRATIDSMTPSGFTNITIGVAWGLAALTPGAPLPGAAPFESRDVTKIMILLTDGLNNDDRFTAFSVNNSAIDSRTLQTCDEVKSKGVRLFTIRVIEGNEALLRSCASSPSQYYNVQNADQLIPVFKAITDEISQVRLTQ